MANPPTGRNGNGAATPGTDTELLSVVGLAELFALPLTALVDADVYGAQAFLAFLKEFAFEPLPNGNPDDYGKLRTVTFFYTANGPGGVPQQMRVEVPWISLVPLPLLSIKDAHIEFEVEVVGITETTQTTPLAKNASNSSAGRRHEKADNVKMASVQKRQLSARLFKTTGSAVPVTNKTTKPTRAFGPPGSSAQTSSVSESSASEEVKSRVNMYVQMNMVQSDLPMGIIQLLNLTQQGTMEQELSGPGMELSTASGTSVVSQPGEKIEVIARVFDGTGKPVNNIEIEFTQDTVPYFSPDSATAYTNSNGVASVTFKLIKQASGQPVIKSIFAVAEMSADGFETIDISAKLDITIDPSPLNNSS